MFILLFFPISAFMLFQFEGKHNFNCFASLTFGKRPANSDPTRFSLSFFVCGCVLGNVVADDELKPCIKQ